MGRTASYDELLTVCIQDLHAAATMLAEFLPDVSSHASDTSLRETLARVVKNVHGAAQALAATGRHDGGAENLWMAGIRDDAQRDTHDIEPGALLDAAMIGAVRKGLAAQIVSYETAMAVANMVEESFVARAIKDVRSTALTDDAALAGLLPGTL